MAPGTRYILVMPEAFDNGALDNCFMTAEVTIEGALELNRFSDEYFKKISDTAGRIDELADERALARTADILGMYQDEIDTGRAELDDAAAELRDARSELDENWKKYDDGLEELSDAKDQLDQSQEKLNDAVDELQDAKAQLDDAKRQLDAGKRKLDEAWAELEEGREELEEAETELDDAREQLESGYEQIEDAKSAIRDSLKEAVTDVLGADIADMIDWSEPVYGIDIDDTDASAVMLPIAGGVTVDLSRSMNDNI